jgi:hypothetical protein
MDHRRLGCIDADPVGQFHRKSSGDYSHLYPPEQATVVRNAIANVSAELNLRNLEDCTKYFKYDKCC